MLGQVNGEKSTAYSSSEEFCASLVAMYIARRGTPPWVWLWIWVRAACRSAAPLQFTLVSLACLAEQRLVSWSPRLRKPRPTCTSLRVRRRAVTGHVSRLPHLQCTTVTVSGTVAPAAAAPAEEMPMPRWKAATSGAYSPSMRKGG